MANIIVDRTAAPVVVVRFVGVATDEEFAEYLRQMTDVCLNIDPLAFIIDSRESMNRSPSHLAEQARWMKEHRRDLVRSAGTAFVIDQPVMRFALSSVFAIAPLPSRYIVKETFSDATAWVGQRLAEQGGTVGESGLEHLRKLA